MTNENTYLTEEQMAGIGLIAVRWNQLENMYEYAIWSYANLSVKQGVSITTHMPMTTRMDALRTYINENFPDTDLQKSLKVLINRTNICRIERNKIMHASWSHSGKSDSEHADKIRISKQLHFDKQWFHVDHMHALAHEIDNITRDLAMLLEKHDLLSELDS